MVILSLDTSSAAGSAAIVRDGHVLVERGGDASRTHAERLPRELMDILDAARCSLDTIDAFAVVSGPGSFTGVRVGLAAVKGLAEAAGRIPVRKGIKQKPWVQELFQKDFVFLSPSSIGPNLNSLIDQYNQIFGIRKTK